MAAIHLETELSVAPDQLWKSLKNVGAVSELLNIVTKSSVDGDQRSCTMADGLAPMLAGAVSGMEEHYGT